MICFVDMEHEIALQETGKKQTHQNHCADVQRRLEDITGVPCAVRHYTRLTSEWLSAAEVKALVIGGNVTDWVKYDEADLLRMYRIIRDAKLPILGICGGLQLIAMAHGAALGPMRRLQEGEADLNPGFASGYFKEWGFVPMRVVTPDPLFDGLGQAPVFLEAHYWDLKEVPPGFELLASSDACRIQAIRRTGRLVCGTQFHPEAYIAGEKDLQNWLVNLVYPEGHTEPHPDGRTLLANFFTLASVA